MVFYRKYRPQTIDDLDSASVVKRLLQFSKKYFSRISFYRPKRIGLKHQQRELSPKVVNCEKKGKSQSLEPCNTCEQCVSITEGTKLRCFGD